MAAEDFESKASAADDTNAAPPNTATAHPASLSASNDTPSSPRAKTHNDIAGNAEIIPAPSIEAVSPPVAAAVLHITPFAPTPEEPNYPETFPTKERSIDGNLDDQENEDEPRIKKRKIPTKLMLSTGAAATTAAAISKLAGKSSINGLMLGETQISEKPAVARGISPVVGVGDQILADDQSPPARVGTAATEAAAISTLAGKSSINGVMLGETKIDEEAAMTRGVFPVVGVGGQISADDQAPPARVAKAAAEARDREAAGRESKVSKVVRHSARASSGKKGRLISSKRGSQGSSTSGTPATEGSTGTKRAKGGSRVRRAQNEEDFDFSFETSLCGYNPRGAGGREARMKARLEKAERLTPVEAGVKRKRTTTKKSTPDCEDIAFNTKGLKHFMRLVKMIRKRRVNSRRADPPTHEQLREVHWVRCCECGKYRALPQGVNMEEMLEVFGLQEKRMWVCSRNIWDLEYATCAKPQNVVKFSEEDILGPLLDVGSSTHHSDGILGAREGGSKSSRDDTKVFDFDIGRRLDSKVGSGDSLRRRGAEVNSERGGDVVRREKAGYGRSIFDDLLRESARHRNAWLEERGHTRYQDGDRQASGVPDGRSMHGDTKERITSIGGFATSAREKQCCFVRGSNHDGDGGMDAEDSPRALENVDDRRGGAEVNGDRGGAKEGVGTAGYGSSNFDYLLREFDLHHKEWLGERERTWYQHEARQAGGVPDGRSVHGDSEGGDARNGGVATPARGKQCCFVRGSNHDGGGGMDKGDSPRALGNVNGRRGGAEVNGESDGCKGDGGTAGYGSSNFDDLLRESARHRNAWLEERGKNAFQQYNSQAGGVTGGRSVHGVSKGGAASSGDVATPAREKQRCFVRGDNHDGGGRMGAGDSPRASETVNNRRGGAEVNGERVGGEEAVGTAGCGSSNFDDLLRESARHRNAWLEERGDHAYRQCNSQAGGVTGGRSVHGDSKAGAASSATPARGKQCRFVRGSNYHGGGSMVTGDSPRALGNGSDRRSGAEVNGERGEGRGGGGTAGYGSSNFHDLLRESELHHKGWLEERKHTRYQHGARQAGGVPDGRSVHGDSKGGASSRGSAATSILGKRYRSFGDDDHDGGGGMDKGDSSHILGSINDGDDSGGGDSVDEWESMNYLFEAIDKQSTKRPRRSNSSDEPEGRVTPPELALVGEGGAAQGGGGTGDNQPEHGDEGAGADSEQARDHKFTREGEKQG